MATPVIDGDGLAQELAVIERARKAMRAEKFDDALAALDAHAKAFPRGRFTGERIESRVEALCRAGRPAQARAVGDAGVMSP